MLCIHLWGGVTQTLLNQFQDYQYDEYDETLISAHVLTTATSYSTPSGYANILRINSDRSLCTYSVYRHGPCILNCIVLVHSTSTIWWVQDLIVAKDKHSQSTFWGWLCSPIPAGFTAATWNENLQGTLSSSGLNEVSGVSILMIIASSEMM